MAAVAGAEGKHAQALAPVEGGPWPATGPMGARATSASRDGSAARWAADPMMTYGVGKRLVRDVYGSSGAGRISDGSQVAISGTSISSTVKARITRKNGMFAMKILS